MTVVFLFFVILSGAILVFGNGSAYAEDKNKADLHSLVNTQIYTASKKNENPQEAASSIFVVTQEDLRSLNVTHFADALRIVPGLQVAKLSSNKWMIASRGFGEQFSNKLLVLLDGRPIYNTLFSGVLWDQQNIPINDIKQIEVVRGTGATLWGSNAVNGVINIITRRAKVEDHSLAIGELGISHYGELSEGFEFSHSMPFKESGALRVSGRLTESGSNEPVAVISGYDDAQQAGSLNIRYDSHANEKDAFNLQSGISFTDTNQDYVFPTLSAPFSETVDGTENSKNAFVKMEYTKTLNSSEHITSSAYLDYTDWNYINTNQLFTNAGLETQYHFPLLGLFDSVAGIGYRVTLDSIKDSNELRYTPNTFDAHFVDTFLQTDIPLYRDQIIGTLGGKIESNTYDSFNFSPNAKIRFQVSPYTMFWTSWSRAYRTPSRGTFHLTTRVNGTPQGYIALLPDEDFDSEEVTTFDFGARFNPVRGLYFDTTVFQSEYEDLRTFEPDIGANLNSDIFLPLRISNRGSATINGFELSAKYQTSPKYKIQIGYSYHNLDFSLDPNTSDTVFLNTEETWPEQMVNMLFTYQFNSQLGVSTFVNYVDGMEAINIPSYTKADFNIFWTPMPDVELIFGVRNLFDSSYPEYSAPIFGTRSEVPRLYSGRISVRF